MFVLRLRRPGPEEIAVTERFKITVKIDSKSPLKNKYRESMH